MKKHELIEFLQSFSDETEIQFEPKYAIENGEGRIINSLSLPSVRNRVYRICELCNKEFELKVTDGHGPNKISSFQNCSHCGKRNDVWIRVETHGP